MFRFNQTRFRNYLTNMKYCGGISVDDVVHRLVKIRLQPCTGLS